MTTAPQAGTIWVGKGKGYATTIIAGRLYELPDSPLKEKALARLVEIDPNCWSKDTNLRLTGAPLTSEDLERIAQCT